ncbi:MAG: hypothetical protein JOZ57_03290, partial [Abitibacteriaceae bacterium]|nr:hypothetical protein [Abditibacteriaceae bacterium]
SVTGFTSGTATVTVTNNDGASLSLSIAPNSFSEGAGANAATGTVTRNTATTLALTVNLSSNNTAKATVPATVDIPAGATSVTFPINAVDNAVADGPQTVVIAASAAGFGTGSATATVTDNDTPTLGLSLSPTIFSEAAGAKATMGTVTRNTPTTSALVVTLSSGNTTKGTVPATVTIPVGATSATFPIAAVDNAIADGPQSVVFTASAPGFTPGTASATVLDNEVAQLSLTVTPGTFSEGAGSHAATGTITRNTPLTSPLVVHLSSSDTTEATVPATVTIPTGQASASFLVAAVNDTLVDGSQVVALNATATGFVPGTTSLTVTDNEPNTLNLSVTPTSFSETAGNSASFGTVTRTGAKTAPLVVTLASNNASAKVPPTITIPAGATFAIFPIGAVDNTTAEGTRNAIISATAPGLPTAKAGVTITDNELPALTLSVSPTTFSEGAGAGVVHGTVTRNTPPTASLVVTLKSSDTTSATVPASITIPAGATAVTFNITPVNNAVVNGPRTVTFMASATGHAPATTSATVTDDEGPTLSVKVNPAVFSEAGGAVASKGTVTRTGSTATALTVALASDNIKKVKVPVSVTIPAGAASATFNIGAVNNTLVDGPQAVTITASASGYNTGAAAVTVNDDDGKLTLTVTPNTFSEGAGAKAAVGTVTRNTPATDSLTVSLKSSDVTEAKVPATVIIPAGSTSVTFPIAAVDDTLVDGSQSVTLTASTAGLTVGTAKITVTDNDHATPPAHAVIAPSTVALSTSAARVTTDSVQLKFTAALDAESASDPAHYGVKVNGQAITVESAAYNATNHSVILSLPEGTLQSGNRVVVEWLDVADSSGKLMTGQTGVLSAQ